MPLIVVGICLGVFGATVKIAGHHQQGGWLGALELAWLFGSFAVYLVAIVAMTRDLIRVKPARFVLMRQGFGVPHSRYLYFTTLMMFTVTGNLFAQFVNSWRDQDFGPLFWFTAFTAVAAVPIGTFFIMFLRGHHIELTPSGITTRDLAMRRTIPWDALAPGGPPRPSSFNFLKLAVTRPEAVTQRGFPLAGGSKKRPNLLLSPADIHPWLLADAIHWYVEHPADRAAIGTRAGHDTLMANLRAVTATAA